MSIYYVPEPTREEIIESGKPVEESASPTLVTTTAHQVEETKHIMQVQKLGKYPIVLYKAEGIVLNPNKVFKTPLLDISPYRLKTVSLVVDGEITFRILLSDDGTDFYEYYTAKTNAGKWTTASFEEDFVFIIVEVENTDTVSHVIKKLTIKGRKGIIYRR